MKRPLIFEMTEDGYFDDDRKMWFPQFKPLTCEQMTYVALVMDYNSPYFPQPVSLRKQRVKDKIWRERTIDVLEGFDEDAQKAAFDLYAEIQYDPIAEQLQSQRNLHDVYTRELNRLSSMGTSSQDVQKIDRATAIQQRAETEIERLEKKQRERIIEDSKTRGDRVTNFYEQWRKDNDVGAIAQQGIENFLNNSPL